MSKKLKIKRMCSRNYSERIFSGDGHNIVMLILKYRTARAARIKLVTYLTIFITC